MPSPCHRYKQYKQSQLNIIHLITLLIVHVCLEIAFVDLLLFCFPLCVCAFVLIFLQIVTQCVPIPAKSKSKTSQGKKKYLTELRVCKKSVDQLIMQLSELKVEVNVSESDRSLALAAQVWPDVAGTSWTNNTSNTTAGLTTHQTDPTPPTSSTLPPPVGQHQFHLRSS